ncbi:hypothetical protein HZ326_3821 [Fusarium oxysporum f. sp. albedinis]|nr:hypothetical protein HZ326_3821 [Fusarium oxysporum f. sp. albedinis]
MALKVPDPVNTELAALMPTLATEAAQLSFSFWYKAHKALLVTRAGLSSFVLGSLLHVPTSVAASSSVIQDMVGNFNKKLKLCSARLTMSQSTSALICCISCLSPICILLLPKSVASKRGYCFHILPCILKWMDLAFTALRPRHLI